MHRLALVILCVLVAVAPASAQLRGDAAVAGGIAFVGSGIGGEQAAKRGTVQLWNPHRSGVDLYLDKIALAWNEWCNPHTSPPCANPTFGVKLGADLRVTDSPVGKLVLSARNKRIGGPAGAAQVLTDAVWSVAIPGEAPPFLEIWTEQPTREFVFDPPIVIPPGRGVVAVTALPDNTRWPTVWYIVDWQWREVPIAVAD